MQRAIFSQTQRTHAQKAFVKLYVSILLAMRAMHWLETALNVE